MHIVDCQHCILAVSLLSIELNSGRTQFNHAARRSCSETAGVSSLFHRSYAVRGRSGAHQDVRRLSCMYMHVTCMIALIQIIASQGQATVLLADRNQGASCNLRLMPQPSCSRHAGDNSKLHPLTLKGSRRFFCMLRLVAATMGASTWAFRLLRALMVWPFLAGPLLGRPKRPDPWPDRRARGEMGPVSSSSSRASLSPAWSDKSCRCVDSDAAWEGAPPKLCVNESSMQHP